MSNEKVRNWTREETMLAFELYCILQPGQDTVENEHVRALAKVIGRTDNSVKLKLQNFKACDPSYTQDGRIGLSNVSRLDREVCAEFMHNWDELVFKTNEIKATLGLKTTEEIDTEDILDIPIGKDILRTRKDRIGHAFFRRSLLKNYGRKCCFTGIATPALLRASHIKPWAQADGNKANPQNGLLLNALHDAAFDKFFITITTDFTIIVSKQLQLDDDVYKMYFTALHGTKMMLPDSFAPDKQFIEYHNNRFRG